MEITLQEMAIKLESQEKKIIELEESLLVIKKRANRSMWISIIFFVFPLVIAIIATPFLMSSLSSSLQLDTITNEEY